MIAEVTEQKVTAIGHTNRKICANCNKIISHSSQERKPILKALGKYYHEECFTCHDCQKPLKPKYFPFEIDEKEGKETILLCQYHYFERNSLLCHVCDEPLRGLYFTAFGNRYDEEHFSCTICHTPCGVRKCFINDDKLYCRFHFIKYFSKRCVGCDFPISDQYIEFPKGDQILCWHPECYGIHKYWHVDLSAAKLGLTNIPKAALESPLQIEKKLANEVANLDKQMQAFSFILNKTWSVLYRFEEEAASCISDMFQFLTTSDQMKGVDATALLVLKVSCLFKGLDTLQIYNTKNSQTEQSNDILHPSDSPDFRSHFIKLPRNLSKKIMIYLQFLRKLQAGESSKDLNLSAFMSAITGLAQYLKLLTRYGLYLALERNKELTNVNPLMKFLREVEKNEVFIRDPFTSINVSLNATDNCTECQTYIQDECIQYHEFRWHLKCFKCSKCDKAVRPSDVTDSTFNKESKSILCSRCSVDDAASTPGFKHVSSLAQLLYLLKIALVKTKTVMELQYREGNKNPNNSISKDHFKLEETYIRTLNDVKRLKSKRESIKLSNDKRDARKSVVLEIPEEDLNNKLTNDGSLVIKTDNGAENTDKEELIFGNNKTLTLDDISRIVAAEQARELRPNAFTHFKTLKEEPDIVSNGRRRTGIYYSELDSDSLTLIKIISLSFLEYDYSKTENITFDFKKIAININKTVKTAQNSNFWNKMWNMMNKEPKKTTPRKVFGTSLDDLCLFCGVDSELGVGPRKIRIPVLIDELVSSLKQLDMTVEGVFRKNGNIRRLRELTTSIDMTPSRSVDFSNENAIQLSALLKKFLRELPDPLLTSELYDLWLGVAKLGDPINKQKNFSLVYSLLPLYNRNVLEVLLSFLNWTSSFSYIENEMGSKMDIHNLSTVITPNILYSTSDTSSDSQPKALEVQANTFAQKNGENYFMAIEVIDYLITHNEDISMIPNFLMTIFEEIKSKNISNFDEIRQYVVGKMNSNLVDFSEFENIKSPLVKNAVSQILQSSIKDNSNDAHEI
ncbi:Rho-type GTPase-activating protein 1 [Nakaseomyces bracarensis]|uniref:Rho-type GTPase-activating protein 1 n=1 Tax=Nakaseomyces bracarensis TaxID=273131 RepID=A0ABR4NWZ2_9SACH